MLQKTAFQCIAGIQFFLPIGILHQQKMSLLSRGNSARPSVERLEHVEAFGTVQAEGSDGDDGRQPTRQEGHG